MRTTAHAFAPDDFVGGHVALDFTNTVNERDTEEPCDWLDGYPRLIEWARAGLIDVIQYDIFGYGVSRWRTLGSGIASTAIRSAPHHYGAHLGNYVTGHLANALPRFEFVEWDEVHTPGIDASDYVIREGSVIIPDSPGFGLTLDETLFQQSVRQNGFVATQ